MALFNLFGKKKKTATDIPPPEKPLSFPSEIPPIKASGDVPLPPPAEPEDMPMDAPQFEPPQFEPPPMVIEEKPEPLPVTEEVPTEAPEPVEEAAVRPTAPMFVAVSDYKQIMTGVNTIRTKMSDVDDVLHKLDAVKKEEKVHFDRWRKQLEDIEKKLNFVDDVLGKA